MNKTQYESDFQVQNSARGQKSNLKSSNSFKNLLESRNNPSAARLGSMVFNQLAKK
jgi:hypothetical protein